MVVTADRKISASDILRPDDVEDGIDKISEVGAMDFEYFDVRSFTSIFDSCAESTSSCANVLSTSEPAPPAPSFSVCNCGDTSSGLTPISRPESTAKPSWRFFSATI